jgi:hypothetical protein
MAKDQQSITNDACFPATRLSMWGPFEKDEKSGVEMKQQEVGGLK